MMIQEQDTVVLMRDIEGECLRRGDVGAVVSRYEEESAFDVEFATCDGNAVACLTLTEDDVRPLHRREILSVRELIMAV